MKVNELLKLVPFIQEIGVVENSNPKKSLFKGKLESLDYKSYFNFKYREIISVVTGEKDSSILVILVEK